MEKAGAPLVVVEVAPEVAKNATNAARSDTLRDLALRMWGRLADEAGVEARMAALSTTRLATRVAEQGT